MSKYMNDKTKWKEVINQPDAVTTAKSKSDPDAQELINKKYYKPKKKNAKSGKG